MTAMLETDHNPLAHSGRVHALLGRCELAAQLALVALGYALAAGAPAGVVALTGIGLSAGILRIRHRRRRLVGRLRRLATRDALTGAWNRRGFEELLAAEQARARRHGHPLSLLALDVDHFKRFNDRHGHAAGDRALQLVSAAIAGHVRASDVFARIGGEEFVLLLPETTAEQAERLAEALRRLIHDATRDAADRLTVSIGVAGAGTALGAELLGTADRALYEAKRRGRNRVVSVAAACAA